MRHTDLLADLPDGDESDDGYHPSQDFTVRCGRCGRSVCSFNVDVYDAGGTHMAEPFLGRDWDHPDPRRAGMTGRGRSVALSVDWGEGFKTTNSLESMFGGQNCWILKCPGRRCRMQQKVSWGTLDRAVARAFLSGQHELVLGVDFSRDR
jgi:hypothetical protein